jgi:hypothetical protein
LNAESFNKPKERKHVRKKSREYTPERGPERQGTLEEMGPIIE